MRRVLEIAAGTGVATRALAAALPAADIVAIDLNRAMLDEAAALGTPRGYHDRASIAHDLAQSGFAAAPEVVTLTERSRADSPRIPALAFCQGTPLRNEIAARDAGRLAEATDAAEREVGRRCGTGAVEAGMRAHVLTVRA
ncbi:MAG TPA: class I SAM-dependent methyltransferase [Casimicrobiaceae bacterium]|nr:class I SAM-dependent methyltransferase [Casimicrobiaceae bacterium]